MDSVAASSGTRRLPERDLAVLLRSRRWLRRSQPFPHVVATDVFTPAVYSELEADFRTRLVEGAFSNNMPGYDALGVELDAVCDGPFGLFVTRQWHDLIAAITGVNATGQISGGLHHHRIGSANSAVHNDLNPGWFADVEREDGIVVATRNLCAYSTGEPAQENVCCNEVMRAVAVLFYLGNPPWSPGDGGETGLYRHRDDDITAPVAIAPPRSNSLLIFECTPHSFHGFLTNRFSERNSLIMWLHRRKADVIERWGEESIVYWRA